MQMKINTIKAEISGTRIRGNRLTLVLHVDLAELTAGIPVVPYKAPPKFTQIPKEMLVDYESGMSVESLARKYDTSMWTIYARLKAERVVHNRGRKKGSTGFYKKLDDDQIRYILQQIDLNISYQTIADEAGVSRERIRQIASASGRQGRLDKIRDIIEQRAEAKSAKRLEYEQQVARLSDLYIRGASFLDISIASGYKNPNYTQGASKIHALRKSYPHLFPYRNPDHHNVKQKTK